MNDLDYLVATYRSLPGTVQGHLADFSEADMLARPAPGANHVAWQLGHLIVATTNLINMVTPGAMPAPALTRNTSTTDAPESTDGLSTCNVPPAGQVRLFSLRRQALRHC